MKTYNKRFKPCAIAHWTQTHGLLRIVAHAFVPLKRKLEGVSLNFVWLNLNLSVTTLTCFHLHRSGFW